MLNPTAFKILDSCGRAPDLKGTASGGTGTSPCRVLRKQAGFSSCLARPPAAYTYTRSSKPGLYCRPGFVNHHRRIQQYIYDRMLMMMRCRWSLCVWFVALLVVPSACYCPNACSGHGKCGQETVCLCDPDWDLAADCSLKECPVGTCGCVRACVRACAWAGDCLSLWP